MILHSTNHNSPSVDFATAVTRCLAPDGGIYMPDRLPRLPRAFFGNIAEMSLREIAYVVINNLLGDTLPSSKIKTIVDEALNFDIPLHRLSDNSYVMELYHGPTLSFKDIGARFMAALLPLLSPAPASGRTIMLATSGDCGGAVANAFKEVEDTDIVVLFPRDQLSREQVLQFATMSNTLAVEVDGTFDDCQRLVRQTLVMPEMADRVVAGNTVNLARQLPSVIYFFYAFARAVAMHGPAVKLTLAIPCGNLGNLTSALMAKKMGLPIHRIIAANSANDVLVKYIQTGEFIPATPRNSMSSALVTGNPLNMSRIVDLCDGDPSRLAGHIEACSMSDADVTRAISSTYNQLHYLVDPQSATALAALRRYGRNDEVGIVLGCIHPAKLPSLLMDAINVLVPQPRELTALHGRRHNIVKIPANSGALLRAIRRNLAR